MIRLRGDDHSARLLGFTVTESLELAH